MYNDGTGPRYDYPRRIDRHSARRPDVIVSDDPNGEPVEIVGEAFDPNDREAALAVAIERGYDEADLIDSDGNPLDAAGIWRSLTVEGGAEVVFADGSTAPIGEDGLPILSERTAADDAETHEDAPSGDETPEDDPEGAEGADSAPEAPEGAGDDPDENADDPEAVEDAGYDPAPQTVAEVQAYLAEHPDQTDFVLTRERGGKARVSLIGA
ncbi:hypothetical protein SEA_KOZIE_25 [Microbacterium phage Kozie]|uniref:Uncharacterized protein n=1 Tax=Microbacterium phage Kozie TaxID=2885981 RepID=A0AAE8Y929_9CAUD|nr:hypothetical protein QC998_gp25 [Microbacterium phage Kozie]UDL16221.1 hypothetical protein SEA_KOZIE_25 [Microbacterium phage Kozie]